MKPLNPLLAVAAMVPVFWVGWLGLLSCHDTTPEEHAAWTTSYAKTVVVDIGYVKDERTGFCFAVCKSGWCYQSNRWAVVPCTPELEEYLKSVQK